MTGAQNAAGAALGTPAATPEFVRYFAISVGALSADFACLYLLTGAGLHYLAANAAAFAFGAVVAYLGSVRWVFARRRVPDRGLEFGIFAAIGVAGLVVNEAALWAGAGLAALPLPAAKLTAAGASFIFNYGVRRAILFR